MVWADASGAESEHTIAAAIERASAEAETSPFMRFMLRHKPFRRHHIRVDYALKRARKRTRLLHAMVYPDHYA